MIYRQYGKTGKKVSLLGMGGNRFNSNEYNTAKGFDKCSELIVTAFENGINYFDTAPLYCEGKSEEIFGAAFKNIKGDFYVSTKTMVTMDPKADDVRRRIELSLKKLNVDKIAFYHMWGILNIDQYLQIIKPGGPYEGALKAKNEGLIEHICFSTHCSGDEIERIVQEGYFEGITLGYNAINFKFREKGLQAAIKAGLGIVTMNPLGGGVIPQNAERFAFIKENDSQTIAQAALLFNASQNGITVVLSGISNEKELQEDLECFKDEPAMSPERVDKIKIKIDNSFDTLCNGCNYCKGCPEKIETNKLMLAYNQYILCNNNEEVLREYLKNVWNILPDDKFHCIDCKKCEIKCTQHIQITKRINEINKIADRYIEKYKKKLDECFTANDAFKIGIYAAGPYAEHMLRLYEEIYGKPNFSISFFDSDPRKWGKEFYYQETIINPPDKIEELGIDRIIIASEAHYDEIYESLRYLEDRGIEILGFGGHK